MKVKYNAIQIPFVMGSIFLLAIILVEFIAILILNNGSFVYTLDDPYIHMALAEHIKIGHYGVNATEFCAPSSSIFWPFILVMFPSSEYFPLFINIVITIFILFIVVKILNISFNISNKPFNVILISYLTLLLILVANFIGLIFTGMEHSLQLLLVTLIALGLIIEADKNRLEPWLLIAIVTAPLIRYENTAVSLMALVYLFSQGYHKKAFITFLLMFICLISFSIFLIKSGVGPFPTSTLIKSSFLSSGGKLLSFLNNLKNSMFEIRGILLELGALGLLSYSFFSKQNRKKRQLALITLFSLILHLIAGNYGWYNRYEIYIWLFFLLILLYLISNYVTRILEEDRKRNLIKIIILFSGFVGITGQQYIKDLLTLPVASNNVYEQHYQMRRFVVDYYQKPVAVNDLGYVSYKNDHYVLDLYGLGSKNALMLRNSNTDPSWMDELVAAKNVELIMIYDDAFQGTPSNWIKIGELHLGKKRITPARSAVSFYASNYPAYTEIKSELDTFIKTLPCGVEFIFKENNE
ncbi:hypothetical protein JW824_03610 [bacterium]|nr:hypothetical protein [bacterium]